MVGKILNIEQTNILIKEICKYSRNREKNTGLYFQAKLHLQVGTPNFSHLTLGYYFDQEW